MGWQGNRALPSLFMSRCWILVGMMGAGKSSVGRALSELGNREFWDTDLMLQNRLGRPISQIFQVYGEEAFRDHETSILRSLEPGEAVLSTGGGIVVREANWDEMQRLGTTIYLEASPETLISRLEASKKKRPLLQVENWPDRLRELLSKREPLYQKADVRVSLDGLDVVAAAEQILAALQTQGIR
jgi:shikimate kinase